MTLPPEFQFSQASLQDFETCPRRFQLRYVERLRWPAIESEPVHEAERLARLGTAFHQLVRQHLDYQRLPTTDFAAAEETLSAVVQARDDPALQAWWHSYLEHYPPLLDAAMLYPEITFSTPLRSHRLVARFDLLAVQPNGNFLIVDWKTSQRKPPRDRLEARWQTRVYPYVLTQAGAALNHGQPLNPANIQLIYWYPATPQEPEIFEYSAARYQHDEMLIHQLLKQIEEAVQTADFPLVSNPRPCQYCVYRSLCRRGVQAGPLLELSDETGPMDDLTALDWEQIAEIQF